MDAFKKLKIGTQLMLSFGVVSALILVLSTIAVVQMAATTGAFEHQHQVAAGKLEPLYAAREALAQTGLAARNAYIFTDDAAAARELNLLDQQRAAYLATLDKMTPAYADDAGFARVRSGLLEMADALKRPRQMREAGKMVEFGAFLTNECSPLRQRIVADIAAVVAAVQAETEKASADALTRSADARILIICLLYTSPSPRDS